MFATKVVLFWLFVIRFFASFSPTSGIFKANSQSPVANSLLSALTSGRNCDMFDRQIPILNCVNLASHCERSEAILIEIGNWHVPAANS